MHKPLLKSSLSRDRLMVITGAVWISVIAFSLAWNWEQSGNSIMALAKSAARSSFQKDLLYRRWAAIQGGVYVPPTDAVPPNPYLSFLPNRDVTTTSGEQFTLVNPAYMTRLVYDLGSEQYGLRGHITSLNPLRPENAANIWETEALRAFQTGVTEMASVEIIDDQPYLSLISPLVTETSCLKCHGAQGYKKGDIRGGICVSVSLAPYTAAAGQQRLLLVLVHAVIGALGLIGLWMGNVFLRRSDRSLRESVETHRALMEESYTQHMQRMDVLLRLNQMTEATLQETTDFALEEAVRLTHSAIGYLAFLNDDESVLTMHSWSKSAMAECAIADKPIIYPVETTGLWGEAVRQRRPVITNDYIAASPLRKGYPEGHVVVRRHMNIPVFASSRIVLVAGVGNKAEEYNHDDVQQLTLLMEGMWRLIERKQAEEALRESEERYRNLLESIEEGYFEVDLNGDFTFYNDSLSRILGYSRDELMGMNNRQYMDKENARKVFETFNQVYKTGRAAQAIDWKFITKDGSERFVEASISLKRDREGRPTGFQGIARDITERKQAEEVMRENRDRLNMVLDTVPQSVFWKDLEGRYLGCNRVFATAVGLDDPTQIIGKTDFDLPWPREEAEGYRADDREVIENNHPKLHIIEQLQQADGTRLWIDTSKLPLSDANGRPLGVLGVYEDITYRKQTEEALQESEEKFRLTFSSSPDAVNINRLEDGLYVDINDGFTRATGYSREEVIGRTSLEIDIWHDPADRQKLVQGLHEKGYYENLEALFRMKDGSLINALMSAKIISLKGVPHIISIVRDITERKKTEEGIAKERTFSDNIINSLPGVFYMFDDLGKLVRWNRKFEEVTGYSPDELLGMQPTDFFSEEHKNYIALRVLSVFSEGEAFAEAPFLTKEGDRVPYFFTGRLTVIDGKQHLLGVGVDITMRIRVEEEKNALQAKLQHAQKFEAIGTLAGGVAHDFNNLLMGIQGRVSLLSFDLEPSHPHREHVNAIEEYIRSATSLTKQLLGFARGGKYEVNPVDMNELVNGSSAMFGRTKKEIRIHTKCQASPLVVEADRGQIEQVLLNMYINAWQAMPPGGGDLYLETKIVTLDGTTCKPHQVEPGRYVKLSITDTGTGMDEATRLRIFDPFFTTKEMGRGTGLGLASAYGIIKNHGGAINVYSEIGHGTTFNIYLPVSDKEARREAPMEGGLIKGSATVLLVDDEELIIDVGQAMLERLGYRVVVCRGGQETVKMVTDKGDEIDVVILDMIMPGMDGGTTFDRIREIQPDIPVILSSGYAINGHADKIMKRGCSGFIQKPYNISELSQKVRKVLDEAKANAL